MFLQGAIAIAVLRRQKEMGEMGRMREMREMGEMGKVHYQK
ncbi:MULTISPECIES: hypothetical protein [Kamptonema]|nr:MULTISPECIES: hypothetical protein [Kamptonema]